MKDSRALLFRFSPHRMPPEDIHGVSLKARQLILSVALCLAVSLNGKATILTFDITDLSYPGAENFPEGFQISQAYGDFVTSTSVPFGGGTFDYGVGAEGFTPNVSVDYGPVSAQTGGPSLWRYNYGDLIRILYQGSTFTGSGTDYDYLVITLQADPGFEVLLYGFELAGWFETDYTVMGVAVYNSVFNDLFPDQNRVFHDPNAMVMGSGPSHTSYVFGTPLRGRTIAIFIDASNLGATSELIGIDNIWFGQDVEIPEPATLTLMIGGSLLLAGRFRTSRRAWRRRILGVARLAVRVLH